MIRALARQGRRWSHGYELCQQLGLKAGTVYPILMRLADRGQVHADWEQDPPTGRPARHLYRLTDAGAAFAESLADPSGGTAAVPKWQPRPSPGNAAS